MKKITKTKILTMTVVGMLSVFNAKAQGTALSGDAAASNTNGASDGGISGNTSVGNSAGHALTTGIGNTFVGGAVGINNSSGSFNTGVGSSALNSVSTGSKNAALGFQALDKNTADDNSAFGSFSLAANIGGTANSAFGSHTMPVNTSGSYNSAFGYEALSANTTSKNSAFGCNALTANTTGVQNDAFGYNTLAVNTTGGANLAVGYLALTANTSGQYNTSVSQQTMMSNLSGSYNVCMGYDALTSNITGSNNTSAGFYTMFSNTSGNSNTANGYYTLYGNTTGGGNTALGYYAGASYAAESNCTFIGANADAGSNSLSNATALGNGAVVSTSSTMYFGNSTITNVYSAPNAWGSDGRFKTNVTENVKGLAFINKLRPVTYNLNTEALDNFIIQNMPDSAKTAHKQGMDFTASTAIVHSGFIAQEVEQAAQQTGFTSSIVVVPSDNTKQHYALSYAEFVVPLVKAVQELSHTVDSLKAALSQSNGTGNRSMQNNGINGNTTTDSSAAKLSTVNSIELVSNGSAIIYQNAPNPFGDGTTVKYFIPDNVSNAQIIFYDEFGSQLSIFTITQTGTGQLNVGAANLANGTYSYSLLINGKVIDTKKMMRVQ